MKLASLIAPKKPLKQYFDTPERPVLLQSIEKYQVRFRTKGARIGRF